MTINDFIKLHGKYSEYRWYNYCEVIITQDGSVFEAVPSHTIWLEQYAQSVLGLTREQLSNEIPVIASPIHWIVERCKVISVWYGLIIAFKDYYKNPYIMDAIYTLKENGLLSPDIDNNIIISEEYSKTSNPEVYYANLFQSRSNEKGA